MADTGATQNHERWLARLLGGDFLLWSPNIQAEGFLHWDRIFATRTRAARAEGQRVANRHGGAGCALCRPGSQLHDRRPHAR
jgi:hypothetical protein